MSDLLSSLRSLLPQEYVREKSSSCDDIEEATNYIKNLETSIKELEDKRDMLKKSSSLSLSLSLSSSPSMSKENDGQQHGDAGMISTNDPKIVRDDDNYVRIHTFPKRIEIEISVKIEGKEGFPISKLLKQIAIIQELEVVGCFSNIVDNYWKCIIHCDLANDQANIDFSELQRKLTCEIST
ncbi:hypothetical protein RND81_13G204300 [Saponaria officinalis]